MSNVDIALQELQAVTQMWYRITLNISGKVVASHMDNSPGKAYLRNKVLDYLYFSKTNNFYFSIMLLFFFLCLIASLIDWVILYLKVLLNPIQMLILSSIYLKAYLWHMQPFRKGQMNLRCSFSLSL